MGLATDKKLPNASKQISFKISEAEKLLFCGFTFMQFYLFLLFFFPLYSRYEFLPSCVSLSALLWEGTQCIKSSRRTLDSSLMCFFKSSSSPRSFYLWKKGHVSTASVGFHRGCWHMPWLMHTGNKRHLFPLSPTS